MAIIYFFDEEGVPFMDTTLSMNKELCALLDKGIDDYENGRVTPHEESMKILMQRYKEYVHLQAAGNGRGEE